MSSSSLACSARGDGYPAGTDPIQRFNHMGLDAGGMGLLNAFIHWYYSLKVGGTPFNF
jgi:hypothetical protein